MSKPVVSIHALYEWGNENRTTGKVKSFTDEKITFLVYDKGKFNDVIVETKDFINSSPVHKGYL